MCADNASEKWVHIPVLAGEVVEYFSAVKPLRRLIDGTLGNGGHSRMLLESNPELEILGIDRDEAALERASENLREFGSRFTAVHGEFADLDEIAAAHNWDKVDGVLLDIGVSSPQIDDPARGFSFRAEGPLDMRMDRTQRLTASRVVNFYSEEDLARIFRDYGELRESRQLARAIVQARELKPLATTADLTAICDRVLHKKRPGQLPSPTLVFQALRIEVNGELQQLSNALTAAQRVLRAGGRLAVISFHSLEDRIVKNFMRDAARECICPPGLPVCVCNNHAVFELPVRGVVTAGNDELTANRRAACAKLRVADRTEFNNQ